MQLLVFKVNVFLGNYSLKFQLSFTLLIMFHSSSEKWKDTMQVWETKYDGCLDYININKTCDIWTKWNERKISDNTYY